MATSPFLSSKERFPHFFRTVPNDVNQARAMLEILRWVGLRPTQGTNIHFTCILRTVVRAARQFGWSYVSVVYSDSEYGDHGYDTLVSLAGEYNVCFSAPHRINQYRFTEEHYNNVVRTIAQKTDVRGEVYILLMTRESRSE